MGKLIVRQELPLDARQEAFAYQREAAEAVRDLDYAAIFHEQGLGKTKIAIDVLLYWLDNRIVDTVLIVAKKSLIANWQREFKLHTRLQPAVLDQSRSRNYQILNSPVRVLLAHYEVVTSEKERFKLFLKSRDVAVILDEAAKIKNPEAEITRNLLELSSLFKKRVIMTGTPVANRPYDVWSQIRFLDQGKTFGDDFDAFRREFDLTNKLADADKQKDFEESLTGVFARISSFSVRETKESGIIRLPQKVIQMHMTDWETGQHSLYQQYRNDLRAIVVREGIPSEDQAEGVLKRLIRLVQMASNPRLVDQSYTATPGKFPFLLDLVQRIVDKRQKCIVWSSFNENVDWLAQELKSYGTRRLHGKIDIDTRNRSVDKFLADPSIRVLVATPGAAKEGLTLTVANHVIFYDRGFSLDDYLQAQDRIHRISQTQTCYVHNLLMPESIDAWVDELLRAKHLAAQLAQGDITLEYYRSQATYDFPRMLREVLGLDEQQHERRAR